MAWPARARRRPPPPPARTPAGPRRGRGGGRATGDAPGGVAAACDRAGPRRERPTGPSAARPEPRTRTAGRDDGVPLGQSRLAARRPLDGGGAGRSDIHSADDHDDVERHVRIADEGRAGCLADAGDRRGSLAGRQRRGRPARDRRGGGEAEEGDDVGEGRVGLVRRGRVADLRTGDRPAAGAEDRHPGDGLDRRDGRHLLDPPGAALVPRLFPATETADMVSVVTVAGRGSARAAAQRDGERAPNRHAQSPAQRRWRGERGRLRQRRCRSIARRGPTGRQAWRRRCWE